jgi:hypothetical protein
MKLRLVLALLALVPGSVSAQAPPAPAPLFRIESFSSGCGSGVCSRGVSWVFRDGLRVAESLDESCLLRSSRWRATSEALADLVASLATARVGLVTGECNLGEFQPNGGFVNTITWFGREGRSSTFAYRNIGPPEQLCSEERVALFEAILRFVSALPAEGPTRVEVFLPTPPSGSCDVGTPPPIPGF